MSFTSPTPPWSLAPPPAGSYRAIGKWGAPAVVKHPNRHWIALLKERLDLGDADFAAPRQTGEEAVRPLPPGKLTEAQLADLRGIVGPENVLTDDYTRARHAYGKTTYDLLRLRRGLVENPPAAVVCPRHAGDVRAVVRWCDAQRVPLTPFGGGSSVTRGVEPVRGGIVLDVAAHMRRFLAFNTVDQTVTVEPGISGPELEAALNDAPARFGAPHAYTCGHFPQSFEHSTVGGWVVTRGAGQNSTCYGKIEELVVSQHYVTPAGEIVTQEVPAQATGPDVDQIMIGSEGAFGVLVAVTLKVFRYRPEARRYFSYVFPDWGVAQDACCEVMQGEFGRPSVFRLSDPEETDVALALYGVAGTPADRALRTLGYRPGERCLLLGTADGDPAYTRLVAGKIGRLCRRRGALPTTGAVARRWEATRFLDPYLRDDLLDFGVLIDTLECAVSWSKLPETWAAVRAAARAAECNSVPSTARTICMAHASHFYPQGANLYFIIITRTMPPDEYLAYQAGIVDAIVASGAALSHHHGVGKLFAPWLPAALGQEQMALLRALKRHFDPNGIMNPGGLVTW
jgi:alkyldihydroxyacetonephosphate synthase